MKPDAEESSKMVYALMASIIASGYVSSQELPSPDEVADYAMLVVAKITERLDI